MRSSGLGVVAVIGLLVGISAASWIGAIEPRGGKDVFAGLKVGQKMSVWVPGDYRSVK